MDCWEVVQSSVGLPMVGCLLPQVISFPLCLLRATLFCYILPTMFCLTMDSEATRLNPPKL